MHQSLSEEEKKRGKQAEYQRLCSDRELYLCGLDEFTLRAEWIRIFGIDRHGRHDLCSLLRRWGIMNLAREIIAVGDKIRFIGIIIVAELFSPVPRKQRTASNAHGSQPAGLSAPHYIGLAAHTIRPEKLWELPAHMSGCIRPDLATSRRSKDSGRLLICALSTGRCLAWALVDGSAAQLTYINEVNNNVD